MVTDHKDHYTDRKDHYTDRKDRYAGLYHSIAVTEVKIT